MADQETAHRAAPEQFLEMSARICDLATRFRWRGEDGAPRRPRASPRRDGPDPVRHPLHGNGPNLFCLSFRVAFETGLVGRDQNLERIDTINIGGDRDDGHHSPSQLRSRGVGPIVGHQHGRATLVRLTGSCRIEIHEPYLAAQHQPVARPSPTATSHTSAFAGLGPFAPRLGVGFPSSVERSKRTALMDHRGPGVISLGPGILIEELDVLVWKTHTQLHTSMLPVVLPLCYPKPDPIRRAPPGPHRDALDSELCDCRATLSGFCAPISASQRRGNDLPRRVVVAERRHAE